MQKTIWVMAFEEELEMRDSKQLIQLEKPFD